VRDGDRVLVKALSGRRRRVGGESLPEAKVGRVLERRHTTLVGTLEIGEEGERWLVPYDPKNRLEVEVEGGDELMEDDWVVVELASGGGDRVRGRVVEVLGRADDPGVDVAVVLAHYRLPDPFPPQVAEAARALPTDPPREERRRREDLSRQVVVTIDGASARDFDDALSVERRSGGGYRVGVHIADVAHFVPAGSPLDQEAFHRGTSVYFPDRAVPMLPERLSAGLCSLQPGVPRLTVSVFLDLDAEGRVENRRFAETVIRSTRRLTYDEVRRVLEEPVPGDVAEYGPVLPLLEELRQVMELLLAKRIERGSVDFDLPEGDVTLDTDGEVVGITPRQRHVAHRIVEELMIAANEAVAEALTKAGAPALFRVHEAPSEDDLRDLDATLRPLGLRLRGELEQMHPSELQRVLAEVEGWPEEEFLTTLVLRTLPRAHYLPECRGHYALAARYYAHFTSPIRRYPDLVVHRAVKARLAGRSLERDPERLAVFAEHTSTAERRAERSERDVLQWKKIRFLEERVGDVFGGRITGVQPFGFFVRLDDFHVDGLVPVRSLDDYYVYEEEEHRLVGESTGRAFRLADPVEVVLEGVDHLHRGLDLTLARLPEPPGRGKGRNKRKPRRR
jgi:ribonuclease R